MEIQASSGNSLVQAINNSNSSIKNGTEISTDGGKVTATVGSDGKISDLKGNFGTPGTHSLSINGKTFTYVVSENSNVKVVGSEKGGTTIASITDPKAKCRAEGDGKVIEFSCKANGQEIPAGKAYLSPETASGTLDEFVKNGTISQEDKNRVINDATAKGETILKLIITKEGRVDYVSGDKSKKESTASVQKETTPPAGGKDRVQFGGLQWGEYAQGGSWTGGGPVKLGGYFMERLEVNGKDVFIAREPSGKSFLYPSGEPCSTKGPDGYWQLNVEGKTYPVNNLKTIYANGSNAEIALKSLPRNQAQPTEIASAQQMIKPGS